MKTVAELLRTKTNAYLYSISPDSSVLDAVKQLAEKRIGALVVTAGGRLVGIVSERDYVRKLAELERAAFDAKVSDIMTAEVITVGPRDSVQHCLQLMTERRLRHHLDVRIRHEPELAQIAQQLRVAVRDARDRSA